MVKTCENKNKPPIPKWFIPPIYSDWGDGLLWFDLEYRFWRASEVVQCDSIIAVPQQNSWIKTSSEGHSLIVLYTPSKTINGKPTDDWS